MDLNYITSERWIHDSVLKEAELGLDVVTSAWRQQNDVGHFLIVWPEDEVLATDGSKINRAVSFDLSDDAEKNVRVFREALQVAKPYALLVVEEQDKKIRAVFETRHGTKSWVWPIHNNLAVGQASTKVDVNYVGLLWRPNKGQA